MENIVSPIHLSFDCMGHEVLFPLKNAKFISFERKQTFKERFEGCHPRETWGFNLNIYPKFGEEAKL